MFYPGECVWSRCFGFGVIAVGGANPVVRTIDGVDRHVHGESLRAIPAAEYDAAAYNREMIDWHLTWRVYGVAAPPPTALPRPRVNLARTIQEHAQRPPLPNEPPTLTGCDNN